MRSDFQVMVLTPRCLDDAALAIAGSRSGAVGVLDLGPLSDPVAGRRAITDLLRLGGAEIGVRFEADADLEAVSELIPLLVDRSARIVIAPALGGGFLESLAPMVAAARAHGLTVLAEVCSLDEARTAISVGADGLIAKGHEAGGRVEGETTFVLLQQLVAHIDHPVWARGGISMHTAPACAAVGAAGVVLVDELALVRESTLPSDVRNAVSAMDGSETAVIGAELGRGLRLFQRAGNRGFETLKRRHDELLAANDHEGWSALLSTASGRVGSPIGWLPDQAWPLGQDACFAARLAERFRTTGGVVRGLLDAADDHLRTAKTELPLAPGSILAQSHGTRYPIVQGPMTRVSDVAPFTAAVAKAGGLPFVALALLRAPEATTILTQTREALGDLPWGVGILGFVPLELRVEQLQVVREIRPRYALIAGGRPDQALELEDEGISTYLHVPSPGLLELFLNQGSRKFVFEGRECGGHVGPRTSFVLWSSMIDLLLRRLSDTELAKCQILFAGGIHDARSSAIVATMAAPLAARGVGIGVLMGTAYLFTREAVETGAIVSGFQKAALSCKRTVVLESAPGHATRATDSPYSHTFTKMRRELLNRGAAGDEIQRSLEELNLGRLRIASKGIERVDADAQNGGPEQFLELDEQEQSVKGLYMIGQVAALRHEPCTMEELHRDVSERGSELLEQANAPGASVSRNRSERPCDIAIVGMSCLLPKAQSIRAYWSNILNKVDAVTEVPRDRWDWHDYYDNDRKTRDRVYSKWGGFLDDIVFDPVEYGMPPTSLSSIEPLQLLTLEVAKAAMKDSGYLDRPFDRERASVILGAGGGVSDLGMAYSFRSALPLLTGDSPAGLMASLPEWTEDSFPGILMNVAAGRVANRLDFGGINCTMDAACAASLAALYLAVQELQNGASDLVITGGADTAQNPFMYLCFAKTQALSPSGRCRTFDQSADGIAISEGIAALVLKRLADAERDGDRIYAVIKGVGGSSDGREKGLTAPRPAGQAKALRRAYARAGFSPATVELIEAHGTGTVAGDKAEIETLKTVFQEEGAALQSCAVGSVKSMIGHTKCTAGVAGLIKIALALHHKVLPPTLHVTEPNREAGFQESPFYVNTELRPWIQPSHSGPRRAGVSAFGFGGTNFHVAVEEYTGAIPGVDVQAAAADWPAELFLLRADSPSGLLEEIELCLAALTSGPVSNLADLSAAVWRRARERRRAGRSLAIVAVSLDDLRAKLESSRSTLVGGTDGGGTSEIFFFDQPLAATGGLAFLYPGQGSQYPNMLSELASYFVELRESFELANRVLEECLPQPLSRSVFPPIAFTPEERKRQTAELTATRIAQPALGAAEIGLTRLLERLGVSPEVTAGHSYGEYMALCAAGVFDAETLLRVSELRGRVIEEEGHRGLGTMAAVTADPARVEEVLGGMSDVWIANLNAPEQTVISGTEEAVDEAVARLHQAGLNAGRFNVACAFHSPLVAPAAERLAAVLAEEVEFKEPRCEVYSNTSAKPFPRSAAQIAEQLVQHLVSPVRFCDEIKAMFDAGVRVFVEVGPKSVLSGLARKILTDHPVAVLAVDPSPNSGMRAFLQLIGALAAHGYDLDLDRLYEGRNREIRDLVEISRDRRPKELPLAAWLVNGGRARPAAQPDAPVAIAASAAPSVSSDRQLRPAVVQAPNPRPQSAEGVATQRTTIGASVPPVPSGPATGGGIASDDLSSIVLQHQRLMARFLETQQTIMRAYLEGSPEGARAVPHAAVGEVHQSQQQGLPEGLVATDPEPRSGEPASAPSMVEAAVEAPAAQTGEPASRSLPTEEIIEVLVKVVSERTGYPAQMLKLDDNVTSDLGIDSIKWVEILGAYQAALPAALGEGLQARMEALVGAKTLAEIGRLTAEIAAGLGPTASVSPAAAAASGSAAALPGPEEIIEVLVSVVSERTGYPVQMLKLDDNITADLGIDSIKWVEILGAYQAALPAALGEGLQARMDALVGAKTLAEIGRLTAEVAAGLEPTASAARVNEKPQPMADAGPAVSSTGQTEDVPRFVVKAVAEPLDESATEPFRSSKVLLVFEDEGGLGTGLCDRLGERGQRWVGVRSHSSVERLDDRRWGVDPADGGQIRELVEAIRAEHGPLAGVLFLSPLEAATAAEIDLDPVAWKRRIDREVKALFRIAQAVAPDLAEVGEGEKACLLAATAMGGRFGTDPHSAGPIFPAQAGIAGLVKTLALEWPAVRCKTVDLALNQPVDEQVLAVLAELDGSDSEIEVGYAEHRRWVLRPRLSASPPNAAPIAPLDVESVVLITGGARGITAQVALELAARYRPRLALLGRSPEPPETENPETAGIEAEGELKKILFARLQQAGGEISPLDLERAYGRLLAEREIRRNLAALRAVGGEVVYLVADVLDGDSVADACTTLRDRFGRIDAVIHGAGIIEDRLLVDKPPASFDRVFDTKVTGLLHLRNALRSDSLELVVLFASVAGRFGNRGQCDYAAANEVMNRLAARFDREWAARVISINWGPWGQTGMASSEVQRRFAERGVQLIGPEGGRAAFAELLETGARHEVEVILGDGPWRRAVAAEDRKRETELPLVTQPGVAVNGHTEWTCILDPSQDPYLNDHRLDGNPVLPAAVALEYIVEAVQKEWPGWHVFAVRDFQVLSGVVLENGPKRICLTTRAVEVASQNNGQVEVSVKLLDGDTGRQCYGARVDLSTSRAAIPDEATRPLADLKAFPMSVESAYERWLFHGPVFQTIQEIQGVTEDVIVGVLKPSLPQACLTCATPCRWLVDPVVVDGAFQLTLLFARLQTGMTPLPARFGTLRLYSDLNGSDVHCVIRARFSAGGQHLETHTTFLSPSGKVFGVLEGAEFTASPALNRLGGQWLESRSV